MKLERVQESRDHAILGEFEVGQYILRVDAYAEGVKTTRVYFSLYDVSTGREPEDIGDFSVAQNINEVALR